MGADVDKKLESLRCRERSLTLSSAAWIEYTNVTDWRRTDTGWQ